MKQILIDGRLGGKTQRRRLAIAAAIAAGGTVVVIGRDDGRFQGVDRSGPGRLLFHEPEPASPYTAGKEELRGLAGPPTWMGLDLSSEPDLVACSLGEFEAQYLGRWPDDG